MATSLSDASRAEPSSDFPTDEDVSPCSRISGTTCVVGAITLAVVALAFLAGRAWARRRRDR